MLNTSRCYRLTLVLETSTANGGDAPVQAVVQCICQSSCCIVQISYEQAALLLVRAFHEPTIIRKYMNTLLEYELVELCREPDNPHLFSAHELADIGIPLDFKRPL
jgi:hypothetical protein